jgi:hypothetical protein
MPDVRCEDRIDDHLASRTRDFLTFQEVQNDADSAKDDPVIRKNAEALGIEFTDDYIDAEDQAWEIVREYPLAISSRIHYRIELSTGGPGDWLDVETDNVEGSGMHGGEILSITYHFNDWFDHAERQLSGTELEAAEAFVSNFLELY